MINWFKSFALHTLRGITSGLFLAMCIERANFASLNAPSPEDVLA